MEMDAKKRLNSASNATLTLVAETMAQREVFREMLSVIPKERHAGLIKSIRARCDWLLSQTFPGEDPSQLRLAIEENIRKLLMEIAMA